ncbi:hypothetical protein BJY24_007882 [Nocardia transvalensis]|uniref:Uncharacterized protein n=1 Tax=Nocardia transvalensis TaxID=37333 RepID=A0A7W9UMT9_9NOCA|nr:hypothetical protein [Nocardia transvalensis]MBB5918949.1 hypothetical protein [Nocardia transvalensis]
MLLSDDNTSPARVTTLSEARTALTNGAARSAAGRLANGLLGADVDAADPVTGDACAEALIAWCSDHGLPYVLRESGRLGGRHVIAVVTDPAVPVRQWARLCRRLARQYGTVVQDRTGQHLRLLTAPHRIGLPSPVIACTASPAQVLDAVQITWPRVRKWRGRRRSPRPGRYTGPIDRTRSGREYGASCAMARAGYTAGQAWKAVRQLGGKAAGLGERWWRRYVWLSAVTVVAAEQGLTEDAAWDLARRACPAACLARGRAWWRDKAWTAAVAEAAVDRPRRYRLDGVDDAPAELEPETTAQIATVRHGLAAAADAELCGLHPQRRHSVRAVLDALATALVTREGSISVRCLAIRARLDTKTVRSALATAQAHGLLVETHAYTGGRADCDAYGPGPAAMPHLSAAARSGFSPTRCTTPAATGRANRNRLHREAHTARRVWSLRCDALAALAPGERLADSQHPAARLLRSIHHQRTWWRSLSPAEQQQRREARQQQMRQLDPADRSAWFGWLARRESICNATDRLLTHETSPDDLETLLAAPLTAHRGMRDPRWRTGGTPVSAAA